MKRCDNNAEDFWRRTWWCSLLRSWGLKFGDASGCEEWREQGDDAGEQTGKAGKKEEAAELQGTDEDRRREGGGMERRKRWRSRRDALEGIGGERWARHTSSPSVWVMVASLLLYCQLSLHFSLFSPLRLPFTPSLLWLTHLKPRVIHTAGSTQSEKRCEGAQWIIWFGF